MNEVIKSTANRNELTVAIHGDHGTVHYYSASINDGAYEVAFEKEEYFKNNLPVSLTLVKEVAADERKPETRPSLAFLNRINLIRGWA